MRISISDLPDLTKSRLLTAISQKPADTFVFSKSRRSWAIGGLILSLVSIGCALTAADDFRWNTDERSAVFLLILASLVATTFSTAYLAAWSRSPLKDVTLVNPLYLLRIRTDEIDVYQLLSAKDYKATHEYNQQGQYTGTTLHFVFEDGRETLKIKSLSHAQEFLSALQHFPDYVAHVLQREDSQAMYQLDLLCEWRMREKQYPRAASSAGRGISRKYALPAVIAAVAAIGLFYSTDQVNDYCDDQKRWEDAATKNTATAYRIYLAARPTGRHIDDAKSAINRLYERAAENYQTVVGFQDSPGVEAVVAILDYARRSGHYKVFVMFEGNSQIPTDIESRLRRGWSISNVVPVQPSFTVSANAAREARIIRRISTSFGRVIPGDILEFEPGRGTTKDIVFRVQYTVRASGDIYYPQKQGHLPDAVRDWYTGISFDWFFEVYVPGLESEPFQFSLASKPADLFTVAYTRYSETEGEPSASQVYDAMADSAFDNFSTRLFSEVSIPAIP